MPPRTFALEGQRAELHVIDVETGVSRLRLRSPDLLIEAPNYAPDGASLYVNAHGRLFRLGVADGDLVELPMPGVPPINNDHVVSPDGETMYVSAAGDIWAFRVDGTDTPRRVSNDRGPTFRHYLHGVSPDGRSLAYIGLDLDGPAGSARFNVCTLDLASGADRALTDDLAPDDGAEYSPDGAWVYFNSERASSRAGHAQLFRVPAAGGEPEQLTDDERVNWFPHPDPAGERIAYLSYPPGTTGHPADLDVIVRIREADGTIRDLAHLFGGQGTMNVPNWSPDGRSIAIVAYPVD